jgi:tetraacyldisaccharide 4'-kinase
VTGSTHRTAAGRRTAAGWWRDVAYCRAEVRPPGLYLVWALMLCSLVYGIVSFIVLQIRARRAVWPPVPVISVGNLVVGGTGKTPLVVHLARLLVKDGHRVVIVSRGYGRAGSEPLIVSRGERPLVGWREAGDEPALMAMIARGAGVVVASRRADGVRAAVEKLGAGVILLDDGMQHVQLGRDLDIVAVDARSPLGNGHLLPAGPLREHPLGIMRAGLIVATRCDRAGGASNVRRTVGALRPGVPVVETRMRLAELWDVSTGQTVALEGVRGAAAFAVAGIADPDDFCDTLERLGFRVLSMRSFPDHHEFTDRDIASLDDELDETGANIVLTTEKDAVRLRGWRPRVPLVAVGIDIEVTQGERQMRDALDQAIARGEGHEA